MRALAQVMSVSVWTHVNEESKRVCSISTCEKGTLCLFFTCAERTFDTDRTQIRFAVYFCLNFTISAISSPENYSQIIKVACVHSLHWYSDSHAQEMYALSIWDSKNSRLTRYTLFFLWIPGHVGIAGNERVDDLTKQATTHGSPFKILPLSEIHRLILQSSIDDWVLSYPSSLSNP